MPIPYLSLPPGIQFSFVCPQVGTPCHLFPYEIEYVELDHHCQILVYGVTVHSAQKCPTPESE